MSEAEPIPPTSSVTALRIPMIKKGEYDLWSMKMRQYIAITDHILWDIITNGDQATTDPVSSSGPVSAPKTSLAANARRNNEKALNILLSAIPDRHLLSFHDAEDAKTLWSAIKARFGGNEASKKMQKNLLKQQFETFTIGSREELDSAYERFQNILSMLELYDAKVSHEDANLKFLRSLPSVWHVVATMIRGQPGLDELEFDDLYNNLKVYEHELKGVSNSNSQNIAFLSTEVKGSTLKQSTADPENIPKGYTQAASSKVQTAPNCASHSDEIICSFFAQQASMPTTHDDEDLLQIDEDAMEEIDIRWQVAMITARIRKFMRKTGRPIDLKPKNGITFDKSKIECFNCQKLGHFARECRFAKYQENRANGRKEKKIVAIEDSNSKALVATDNNEEIDWTKEFDAEPVTFAMMALTELEEDDWSMEIDAEPVHFGQDGLSDFDWSNKADDTPVSLALMATNSEARIWGVLVSSKEVTIHLGNTHSMNLLSKLAKGKRIHAVLTYSGCSGSMTGDKDKLTDFKEFKGGYVAFGNDPKGGRITRKGTIKTSCIDFEKHNVLFTYKECIYVISKCTKDEKKKKGLVYGTEDWGTVNFKNINKLVKGNLVRGLPSKTFKLDHSCLACRKGKQHRASCKKIEERTVREPLELLHMDLFGPISVESVNRKKYCLVVTDDCSKFSWVFFLAYKDETYDMLHDLIVGLENKLRHKVKTIRCDHGTEFKNHLMNEFCAKKGIKREYSIARTPQQNGVAERKNRTLIEAARTMLADSLLPIQFWAEAVNTACYVLNRVLVTKPQMKTPYEILMGRSPNISFMRPFGCPLTILNTLDQLGKFDGKSEEGYLLGYSTSSKGGNVSTYDDVEDLDDQQFIVHGPSIAAVQDKHSKEPKFIVPQRYTFEEEMRVYNIEKGKESANSTLTLSTANTPSQSTGNTPTGFFDAGQHSLPSSDLNLPHTSGMETFTDDDHMRNLSDSDDDVPKDGVFSTNSFDDENTDNEEDGAPDYNNMDHTIDVSSTLHRIHKNHPQSQIIGKSTAGVLTRRKLKESASDQHQALLSFMYKQNRTNHKDQQTCLFACFLSQEEPKKVSQALADESWVEAMQEELLQFKLQNVWVLCDLPDGKGELIGTKWVFRNKRDERGTIIKNKARLVAQGYRQEEGVDYDEVFAPVARIEAIRLFLAFASFMGFTVYQMDVKSAFLYGNITEEILERGYDKTLFIKKDRRDIMLVQVYVDDIIFGSTKPSMVKDFEELMQKEFKMSSMGELTFFLGLQVKQTMFMIGCLMYLTASRPDIMFAVCLCARFQVTPKVSHMHAIKRIFSDYAGDNHDRRSTSGGCQYLGRRLVSWQCKKQTIMAISSTEAEYVAAASCCAQNPVLHSKTKHIQIRHHFIRDCYEQRLINVVKVHTDDNVADLLTKGFDLARFNFLVVTIERSLEHLMLRLREDMNIVQVLSVTTDVTCFAIMTNGIQLTMSIRQKGLIHQRVGSGVIFKYVLA
ncbi:putative RNA-directed DNA polymerase [Tanacetum coccineum]